MKYHNETSKIKRISSAKPSRTADATREANPPVHDASNTNKLTIFHCIILKIYFLFLSIKNK